jgi:hypothetical protein
VEHKYSQSRIVTEELRWVHGVKGQVAQQDRVKPTMTGPDLWRKFGREKGDRVEDDVICDARI